MLHKHTSKSNNTTLSTNFKVTRHATKHTAQQQRPLITLNMHQYRHNLSAQSAPDENDACKLYKNMSKSAARVATWIHCSKQNDITSPGKILLNEIHDDINANRRPLNKAVGKQMNMETEQ